MGLLCQPECSLFPFQTQHTVASVMSSFRPRAVGRESH
jgi:hypothetical protein